MLLVLWGAEAAAGADDLAAIAGNIKANIQALDTLLTMASYIVGIGFAIAGIVQFKAHKDNPAQVPLSKPMVYLFVGAALLFLPTILETAGGTIFGAGEGTKASEGIQ